MATFHEANQVRLKLKMELYGYAWYNSSSVVSASDGYSVLITVNRLSNEVKKLINPITDGVEVKVEVN